MGIAPADLLNGRVQLATVTGCAIGNIGIQPDPRHLEGGGYHCGSGDLKANGNTDDYSIRQARDRAYYNFEIAHGGNYSSAIDMDDDWPRGGRAAWIRWNNMIVADLRTDPNRIPGLRALNFSPDGAVKRRYDSNNPGQGIIPSTDTVLWHTHLEFWRDTVATAIRAAGLNRLVALADAAIRNVPAPATTSGASVGASTPTLLEDTSMFVQIRNGDPNAGGIFYVMPGAAYHVTANDWNNWGTGRPAFAGNCPWSFVAGLAATDVNSDVEAFTVTPESISAIAHQVATEVAADPQNALTSNDIPQMAEAIVAKFSANLAA